MSRENLLFIRTDPVGFLDGLNLYAYVSNDPLSYGDSDGRFAIPLLGLSWGASGCAATAIFSNPIGGAIGGAVITAVAVGWATQQLIESRNISTSTGSTINTVFSGLAGSMINSIDYYGAGSCMPNVGSSYGWVVMNNSKTDVYAPDRPLPMTEDGVPVPEVGVPHTELGMRDGSKGKYPQAREFDENGKPVRDIDFTDHGKPKQHTNPHQHRPIPNPTGGTPARGKPEPVPEWSYK